MELTKATSKNDFLLPKMEQLVDDTASPEVFSFMDAVSGYNHI